MNELFQKGLQHAQSGNFKEAINNWEEYIKYNPRDYAVWSNLATLHIQLKSFTSAEKCTRKALKLKPNNSENWDKLGSILSAKILMSSQDGDSIDKKAFKESIKCFKKSLKQNSRNHQALFKIGSAYATVKDFENARKYVNKYLKLYPNDTNVKELLRIINIQAAEGSNTCKKCGAELQENVNFCAECGTTVETSNGRHAINVTRLAEMQKKEIAKYPGFPDGKPITSEKAKLLEKEAWELSKKGEFNQAISRFNEAIAIEPEVAELYDNIGRAYASMKDFQKAKQYFQKATDINRHQIRAWEALELIYQKEGNLAKREEIFQRLKAYGTVYANYLVDSGFRIINSPTKPTPAQNKLAEYFWKRALLVDPDNQQAQFHLNSHKMFDDIAVELDKWKGNYDKAVEYYRKQLEMDPNNQMLFSLLRGAEMRQLGLDLF